MLFAVLFSFAGLLNSINRLLDRLVERSIGCWLTEMGSFIRSRFFALSSCLEPTLAVAS